MNADQVAKKFFESGCNNRILTKKQTEWLFSFDWHDDINGRFELGGKAYLWYASKKYLRYGVSKFEVLEVKEREVEEKHPLQIFMESKGFKNSIEFMNAPNYFEMMQELASAQK